MPQAAINPAPGRVVISHPTADGGERELPFRLLCLADLAGANRASSIAARRTLAVHATGIDAALAAVRPVLRGCVPDHLGAGELSLELVFTALADFAPPALVRAVPALAAADQARTALSKQRLEGRAGVAGDAAIAAIAARIAAQTDAILHWEPFRRLEAAWRGLDLLLRACADLDGIQVHALAATREELEIDLDDAPEPSSSGVFRQVHGEYGQYGGEPWSAVVVDAGFGPARRDVAFLRRLAAVGAAAHAPVLAGAAPELVGLAGWQQLGTDADLAAAEAGPALAAWRAFRQHDDARYAALALPRILLRQPWGGDSRGHRERLAAGHADLLWGNPAWALAARLAAAHASHGWCSRISGPAAVPADPQGRIAVETALSEELCHGLAESGLVPLMARRGAGDTWIPIARTVRSVPLGGRTAAERSTAVERRLGAGLAGVMVVGRIAHHLKAVQRERLGAWADRAALQRGLEEWLGGHVIDMDDPDPGLLARRPLRSASIRVEDVPGRAGFFRVALEIAPHPAWLGARCTLTLVSRLERVP